MRSVADQLRRELAARVATLSGEERLELSLRLGDEDVAAYAEAHHVSAVEARDALRKARAIGRIPSRSHDGPP